MPQSACQELRVLAVTGFGKAGEGPAVAEVVLARPDWPRVKPGQFIMVRPRSFGLDPLWARPFSIYRATPQALHLLVQVVGRGTALLAALNPGDTVVAWGPLGSFFAVQEPAPTLMLGGGIGVAPFRAYIEAHPAPQRLSLVFGHTQPLSHYPWPDLAGGVRAEEFHQQTPADLDKFIALLTGRIWELPPGGLVLACGPLPFMRTVKDICDQSGARCQVSLENRMACGVGACLGCVCRSAAGEPVQVCSRGPVFWAQDVDLAHGLEHAPEECPAAEGGN
jgi:dihydroorotate dehydrogenase electron transfer subunit